MQHLAGPFGGGAVGKQTTRGSDELRRLDRGDRRLENRLAQPNPTPDNVENERDTELSQKREHPPRNEINQVLGPGGKRSPFHKHDRSRRGPYQPCHKYRVVGLTDRVVSEQGTPTQRDHSPVAQ